MSDLTWKPGPPPLDVPGYYICETRRVGTPLRAMWISATDRGPFAFWEASRASESLQEAEEKRLLVLWHFGPIPSPPSGDTE